MNTIGLVGPGPTWKTVSIASPMLSKDVIPAFGPAHFSRHTDTFVSQMFAPHLNEIIMIMMTVTVTMLRMLMMELTVHL